MLVLLVVVLCVVIYGLQPLKRWTFRRIPGPPPLPFVGNVPDIVKYGTPYLVPKWQSMYGSIFKMWIGRTPVVIVTDPELGRQVMHKLLNHAPLANLALGEAAEMDRSTLVTASDELWRTVRAAWAPAFNPKSFVGYAGLMDKCALQLCDLLRPLAASGQQVDIWTLLGKMTLQVVGTTAYGVDFQLLGSKEEARQQQQQQQQEEELGQSLVGAVTTIFSASRLSTGSIYAKVAVALPELRPLVARLAHICPDATFANLIKARRRLMDTCRQLVAAWKVAHHGSAAGKGRHGRGIEPGSFLGLILDAESRATGKKLSELQVLAQPYTFMLAGYETTANALAYTIYCLASHPHCEQRLLCEVDALGSEQPITMQDLDKLPYAEAVFKEALRLYPPATITTRVARQPLQLGKHTIPAGTPIFVSLMAIMANGGQWRRPQDFLPERFLQEGEARGLGPLSPAAYMPFGGGSRLCIGYKFAIAEAKVALARLYQRYTFKLTPGQVPLAIVNGITMSPKYGVNVTVHARH